jgi:hypothetical protein
MSKTLESFRETIYGKNHLGETVGVGSDINDREVLEFLLAEVDRLTQEIEVLKQLLPKKVVEPRDAV